MMNWNDLEKHFSSARLGRYHAIYRGNESKAADAYVKNMLMAEAMMPTLNIVEIALKNGIHRRFSAVYHRDDWWESWRGKAEFEKPLKEIDKANSNLQRRFENRNPDKIVAELTFGFWSSLFNSSFQTILWPDLRLVFSHCPRPERKRQTISSALNQVRNLRNRVFHHEPLLWLDPSLKDLHTKGITILGWLDPQLVPWLAQHDRFPANWAKSAPI